MKVHFIETDSIKFADIISSLCNKKIELLFNFLRDKFSLYFLFFIFYNIPQITFISPYLFLTANEKDNS